MDDKKTSFIVDDKPVDDEKALVEYYKQHGIKLSSKMRHFSFDYAKQRAEKNHV